MSVDKDSGARIAFAVLSQRDLGFDLEERQLLMGHESSATTERYYGRLTIEDVARKVARL